MVNAKLLVPSGAFVHDNCGETFSPPQLAGAATLGGISVPSLKVDEDSTNVAGAPTALMHNDASIVAPPAAHSSFARLIMSAPRNLLRRQRATRATNGTAWRRKNPVVPTGEHGTRIACTDMRQAFIRTRESSDGISMKKLSHLP